MGWWRSWAARMAAWPTWGSAGVGAEAAAFLRGEVLQQLLAGGSCWNLPPWVWLNTAAHASRDRVAEVATTARSPYRSGPVEEWGQARAVVARELLDMAGDDPVAFDHLQREVLVRLEQEISSVPDLTPARLADIAVAELRLIGA
jgi:hypothetical protein